MWITFFSSHTIISYTVRMTRLGHWILVEHSSTNCIIVRHQEKIPKGFSKNHCTIPGCSEPCKGERNTLSTNVGSPESQIRLVSFVNECSDPVFRMRHCKVLSTNVGSRAGVATLILSTNVLTVHAAVPLSHVLSTNVSQILSCTVQLLSTNVQPGAAGEINSK